MPGQELAVAVLETGQPGVALTLTMQLIMVDSGMKLNKVKTVWAERPEWKSLEADLAYFIWALVLIKKWKDKFTPVG